MSLVIAAMSYSPRSRLHSASISAVLPEPTGPPTPTRRGPFTCFMRRLLSRPEQPRVLRLVPHGGDIGAECCAADLIQRRCQRARGGCRDEGLERGEQALPVGLAERNEPHTGRDQVRRYGMQIGGKRRLDRDTMSSGRD